MWFCFGFILLFTSSSPYRKDQFAVRIFLQVVIVLMLQLGNPVPLIGLSLWICLYFIYIFLDKDSPINIVMHKTNVMLQGHPTRI